MRHILEYITNEGLKINKSIAHKVIRDKNTNVIPYFKKVQLQKEIVERAKNVTNGILDLSDIDISNIDEVDYMFHPEYIDVTDYLPQSIHTIDVTGWDVSNQTDLEGMFFALKYVKRIIGLDTWDVSQAKTMNHMFCSCSQLEDIGDISHWDVHNLELCRRMFGHCWELKEVDLSGWDPVSLKACNSMFRECTSLEKCEGPVNWDKYSIDNYRNMFISCDKLKADIKWTEK